MITRIGLFGNPERERLIEDYIAARMRSEKQRLLAPFAIETVGAVSDEKRSGIELLNAIWEGALG